MARTTYGGTADDVIITPVTIGGIQVAGLPAAQTFQVWNLDDDTQLTDVQDTSGVALPSGLVTSSSTGLIPSFRGPDGYTGPIRLKHTTTGTSWILNPADPTTSGGGGGGVSLPNTLVVAASDSGITDADYVCDGTADNTEIQAAITATALNGTVQLTAGTFNLAAVVNVDGADDVDVEGDIYIRGAGPSNTTLVVGSGVAAALNLRKAVRVHISDLGVEVTGSSDGIQATHSTTPAAGLRSAWFSSIERVQVKGPWDGSHTGWGLDLENVFRFRCANVEVGGTGNGIRMINSTAAFNAGDSTFDRCFVEVVGTNAVAYGVESTLGNMNQCLYTTCHSIADPAFTGTVAWKFSGAGNTSHIRTINCNVEQFSTTVQVASTAYDIDVDLVHVTLRNGSVLADLDGYGSRVRCGLAYIEPSATVTLVDDDNGYALKPNVLGPVDIYADTGSTVNADTADTLVLRDVTYDGPGTIATSVRMPPAIVTNKVVALTDGATVAVDASRGNHFRLTAAGNRTLLAPSNPTDGQRITVEHIASGGARTLSLTTGSPGAFQFPSAGFTSLSATASGVTDLLEFVYSSTLARWRLVNVSKG